MANRVERQHLEASSSVIGEKVKWELQTINNCCHLLSVPSDWWHAGWSNTVGSDKSLIFLFFFQDNMKCVQLNLDVLTACPTPETKLLTVKGAQENLTVSRSFVEIFTYWACVSRYYRLTSFKWNFKNSIFYTVATYEATIVGGNSECYVQIIKKELWHIMRWEVLNCFNNIGQTDTWMVLMFHFVATAC